ncbi:hypothetical protein DFH06DRAFT_1113177 [Mycena polygramma]|nr:hypothetical protein DFH06DRAFT_1113177 [Mycena polygramma]
MDMFSGPGSGRRLTISGGVGGRGGEASGTGGVAGAGGNGGGPQLNVEATESLFVDVRGDLHFSTGNVVSHRNDDQHQSSPGAPITLINAHNVNRHGDTGLAILHGNVALDALHNSFDSFPQPRCHPETRQELLEKMWKYLTAPEHPSQILWLYGPAGAGKSATMWSLCERLEKTGRLGGTFFFKRGHPTRGNAKALFSTIAYRLALLVPWLSSPIQNAVERDPTVVASAPEFQFQRLILGPCSSAIQPQVNPAIIIIDGLDECDGQRMQQEILRVLNNSFQHLRNVVRIVIASRPEAHISDVISVSYQGINIEQSFEDVQKYLVDEFSRIHRTHPTMANIPWPWPSPEDVETLVCMSSGHFLYPSTVIKFIDDLNYRPHKRLAAILGDLVHAEFELPFKALDQLYSQILNSIPIHPRLLDILHLVVQFDGGYSPLQIDKLFELESGDTELALRGLRSLVSMEQNISCIV